MAKYNNSPIVRANLAAILAIARSDLPDAGSGIYPFMTAENTGINYVFDPDSTTIGFLPTGSSSAGRWIPINRETLTANRTYFVRTDGNDNNTGLANTAGGAFATWTKAIDVLATLDGNGFTATIQGTGTFPDTNRCVLNRAFVGFSKIIIEGNVTTPTNCILTAPNVTGIADTDGALVVNTSTLIEVRGMGFGTTATNGQVSVGLTVVNGTCNITGNCDFGVSQISSNALRHIYVVGNSAILKILAAYAVTGNGANHLAVFEQGLIESIVAGGITNTVSGSIAFSQFAGAGRGGTMSLLDFTWIGGTVTGIQYSVGNLAAIYAIGTTAFRGSSSGTVEPLGRYGAF